MDSLQYKYMGKTWRPCPTVTDGNCFFNSAFGTRDSKDQPYYDKRAKFRRMNWSMFLIYYNDEDPPGALFELLKKCFIANDRYQHKSIENPDNYTEYTEDITISNYRVLVEEIPLLVTLENIRVILFTTSDKPEVFNPNPDFLGKFPLRNVSAMREVAICLVDKHFSRLEPYDQSSETDSVINEVSFRQNQNRNGKKSQDMPNFATKKEYKKRGDAGLHGSLYQTNLLTMVLLNGIMKVNSWRLSTEDEDADKFDDLIFKFLPSESAILLQAKHKKDKKKKVTYEDLVSVNYKNDFGLPKYFVSYQEILKRSKFKVQNIVICTNLDLDEGASKYLKQEKLDAENVLHFHGTHNICYNFKGCSLPQLKLNIETYCAKNEQNKKVMITDEAIEGFLAHLQFFPNYLDEDILDNVIEKAVSGVLFNNLDKKMIFEGIHKKILDWFIKENKGRCLTEVEAKGFLCDIRSNKYCDDLKLYDISFEQNNLPFIFQSQQKEEGKSEILQQKIERSRVDAKRISHIIPDKEHILNVIKIYQALQSGHQTKALFVNPDETIYVQRQIIDAFEVKHYTILVIVCHKLIEEDAAMEMCNKVIKILNNYTYKHVILVAEEGNNLTSLIKNSNSSYCETIADSITFTDLKASTQEKFKQKKIINFQGSIMSLEELFRPCTNAVLNLSVDSEILVKLARSEETKVGLTLQALDKYYISRTFNRNGNHISEENMCLPDEMNKEKVALISDSAGMGKSTVLTSLAIAIKKHNPHLWVIRVDLNDCTNIMRASLETGTKDISILQLLESQEGFRLKGEFEEKLFKNRERVVLIFDGVDEICPNYTELILNLLKELPTQLNMAKILVTTRPHLRKKLEEELQVQAFTMKSFSEENQTNFLTNYWTEKLHLQDDIKKKKCEHYAKALIREMSRWIKDTAGNMFAGIPLQTKMLAEVFQEGNGKLRDWEGCKEFLSSESEEPRLPKRINLIRLYEMFIDKKRDIFGGRNNPGGGVAANAALKEKFEQCHEYHRSLALEIIFNDSDELELFSCHKDLDCSSSFVENYVLRVGILQLQGEKLHFIHRTFAEYFVAESMLIELKKEVIDRQLYQFLMKKIFFDHSCDVIRAFLDSFIKAELPSVKNKIFKHFWTYDDTSHISRTLLYKIAEAGCVEILTSFVEFVRTVRIQSLDVQAHKHAILRTCDYNEPLRLASSKGYLDVVKILVESAQICIGSAPIEAIKFGHLDLIKFLEDEPNTDVTTENGFEGSVLGVASSTNEKEEERTSLKYGMALRAAAEVGHLHIVKFLAEFVDVDQVDWEGRTALYKASEYGYLDVVKFLVEEAAADVNKKMKFYGSALQIASEMGHLNVIKYLVERGANEYNNALSQAAQEGHFHPVKFLTKFADVNQIDSYGMTALCAASEGGFLGIVKFLVEEAGADVNKENKIQGSALEIASFRGHLNVVEYLLQHGANEYNKALIVAADHGYLHIVKILVQFADTDEVDSALYAAYVKGYLDVVKFLVEEAAADVNKENDARQ